MRGARLTPRASRYLIAQFVRRHAKTLITATNRIADAGSLRAVVMPRMADRSCSKQSNATVLYGRERQDHDVPAVWEASAPGASRLLRGQLGSHDCVG